MAEKKILPFSPNMMFPIIFWDYQKKSLKNG